MAKSLIIVESPAKTRTIGQFVGKQYQLEASMGHVRDLPKSALGVDIEHGFQPKYLPLRDRGAVLKKLRAAVAKADEVYLATDPDREGEAIAWHLAQSLKIPHPRRIEFNEITRRAVTEALAHPREIDMHRVDAQQARRVLDRLVGYKLSPLLQKKMRKWGLSAGRVQSVAVKLICDREREIEAFIPQEFWDVTAYVTPDAIEQSFPVKLMLKDGKKATVPDLESASRVASDIWEAALIVEQVKESQNSRRPPAPFITSTLQQEAANRLGMSARQTMRVAQDLYEGVEFGGEHVGLITYMRTDSPRVAPEAQDEARRVIVAQFGETYLPDKPRQFAVRRGAQEAHEAIRPTSPARTPDEVAKMLSDERQVRLYRLIWSRFMASQMADQCLKITAIDVSAGPYVLRGRGIKVLFPGFTAVYPTREREAEVPELRQGQWLNILSLGADQRFTEPPPRYTEASLVRELEQNGIGRPSTYAAIIGTIQDRGYVYLEDKHFRPTDLGFAVTDQLVAHFPDIINVEFTAGLESKLDEIEEGEVDWVRTLEEFYGPFNQSLERAETEMENVSVKPQETEEKCELCGKPMLLRVGRRGPFLACSGYPECKSTRPAPGSAEAERPQKAPPEPTDQVCDKCGSQMVIRTGRRGRFLACSAYPKCKNARPLPEEEAAAAALAANETCDLCGKPMSVRRGRFGPFLGCTGYPECKGIKKLPKTPPETPTEDDGS
ncbi:MAG: type I DNA topoisomerase [Armatimonadota bacterium]|jgi:DNA topoisomerase-1